MDARNNTTHLSTYPSHNHSSAGPPLSSARVGRHLTKYQQAAPRPTGVGPVSRSNWQKVALKHGKTHSVCRQSCSLDPFSCDPHSEANCVQDPSRPLRSSTNRVPRRSRASIYTYMYIHVDLHGLWIPKRARVSQGGAPRLHAMYYAMLPGGSFVSISKYS